MADTLMFTDLPKRPNQTELDAIMRDVSRQLGETWTSTLVGKTWYIYRGHPGVVSPHVSRKLFISALSDATGCTIINDVSF
jgi:hypothetical protein